MLFDEMELPAKAIENRRRGDERAKLTKRAAEACDEDLSSRLLSQAASITYEDITSCIKLCIEENIQYIVSLYESDAQTSFLLDNSLADVAITEDSDLIAYGCDKVLTKLNMNGNGEFYSLNNILQQKNVEKDTFLNCCITTGCDYLKNVGLVGIYTALNLYTEQDINVFSDLSKRGAPPDYESRFVKAKAVFNHQTVFNPISSKTRALREWPTPPSQELQHYCGEYALIEKYNNHVHVFQVY